VGIVQGLLIPFFLKLKLPILNGWFLSALNCFAGGVFLTFGEESLLCSGWQRTWQMLVANFHMTCTCLQAQPLTILQAGSSILADMLQLYLAGFMHLLPGAVSAMPDSLSDAFPMAYFFAALGFYILFVLQKVVSPMLSGKGGPHLHGHDHNACTSTGGCCATPPGLAPVSNVYSSLCVLTTGLAICPAWAIGA